MNQLDQKDWLGGKFLCLSSLRHCASPESGGDHGSWSSLSLSGLIPSSVIFFLDLPSGAPA